MIGPTTDGQTNGRLETSNDEPRKPDGGGGLKPRLPATTHAETFYFCDVAILEETNEPHQDPDEILSQRGRRRAAGSQREESVFSGSLTFFSRLLWFAPRAPQLLSTTVLHLPFDYYFTFVIEQKYGFNKQTVFLFLKDKVMTLALSAVFGGPIVAGLLSVIKWGGERFYLYVWHVAHATHLLVDSTHARSSNRARTPPPLVCCSHPDRLARPSLSSSRRTTLTRRLTQMPRSSSQGVLVRRFSFHDDDLPDLDPTALQQARPAPRRRAARGERPPPRGGSAVPVLVVFTVARARNAQKRRSRARAGGTKAPEPCESAPCVVVLSSSMARLRSSPLAVISSSS